MCLRTTGDTLHNAAYAAGRRSDDPVNVSAGRHRDDNCTATGKLGRASGQGGKPPASRKPAGGKKKKKKGKKDKSTESQSTSDSGEST